MDEKKIRRPELEETHDGKERIRPAEEVYEGGYYSEISPSFPDVEDGDYLVSTPDGKKENEDAKKEN